MSSRRAEAAHDVETAGIRALNSDPILEQAARVPPHVVYRAFAAETVVLNLTTGRYHGVNPAGGRMLEVLESSDTVRTAAVLLAGEYDRDVGEVERDIVEFCTGLAERGLIELRAVDQPVD